MWGNVNRNICEYMNSRCINKKYTIYQVNAIKRAILAEYHDRKVKKIYINGFTRKGKKKIYTRIAKFANRESNLNLNLNARDIRLCKLCTIDEYQNRTGKCSWGIAKVRESLGYNPITGLEIEEGVKNG